MKLIDSLDTHISMLDDVEEARQLKIFMRGFKVDYQRYEELQTEMSNTTRLQVIKQLRSRVSFYGIYSMWERVEKLFVDLGVLKAKRDIQGERLLHLEHQVWELRKAIKRKQNGKN